MNVVVVGGGVIGLSVAWELARRGATVRLLERAQLGSGTTVAAAGILPAACPDATADAWDRLRGLSHRAYPDWVAAIEQHSGGVDVGWRRCGGYYLASTAGESAALSASGIWWADLGIEVQRLDKTALIEQLPGLASWLDTSAFPTALFCPDECQVRPPELVRGLAAACRHIGVQIDERVEVSVARRGDEATLQLRRVDEHGPGQPLPTPSASHIVLCGGVWNGQLAQAFGLGMSMVPIRGQMLLYRLPQRPFASVVNEGHRYFVPRDDGYLLVGSCEEEAGFDRSTTEHWLATLAHWAQTRLEWLADIQPVKSWAGLRPGTIDGFPLIGAVPETRNLYVAAGHFRSGIHLAPATASMLADLMEDKPTAVDSWPFRVGRLTEPT